MKIVFLSDTHTKHWDIDVPDADILVHSGDATFQGTVDEIKDFNKWLDYLPHEHKIFVPGNHDWLFETNEQQARELMSSATVLIDEAVEIQGLKFWGSPWQPEFCNWAFNLPRGKPLADKWALIPSDTQVLITHGPPFGMLDVVIGRSERLGCEDLIKRINELKELQLHAFGHIHSGRGVKSGGGVTFINGSNLDERYRPMYNPVVIDMENIYEPL